LLLALLLAVLTYSAASQTPPQPPDEARFDSGIAHALAGEFDQARTEIEAYRERAAYSVPAREVLSVVDDVEAGRIEVETAAPMFRGIAFFNKDEQDEAIAEFDQALSGAPGYARAYYNRGIALWQGRGQDDNAIVEFTKVLELEPDNDDAYTSRGGAHEDRGEFEEAIADYSSAIELNPTAVYALFSRGSAYYRREIAEPALADLTKAIELDPNFANSYNYRGLLYMRVIRDRFKACPDWKRACELGLCQNYRLARTRGLCVA
jgi:tetratricopeptide (TPR) repeat protein